MIEICILAAVAFAQNAVFTAVSRSRNSGDPAYHRRWAYASNGIWFVANVLIWRQVWRAIETGEWWYLAISFAVYVVATSEGSVMMMRRMLRTETGSRRVGAYGDKK
jgi:hypothetical protein